MKVRDLIAELEKCPQDSHVVFFVSWGDERAIQMVSPEDVNDNVVLGTSDLPAEKFARDSKYE